MMDLNHEDIKYVSSAGDGACLFNSVAQAIHLDDSIKHHEGNSFTFKLNAKDISQKSRALRLKAVEWMEENLDIKTPTGLTLKEDIQDSIDNDLPDSINTIKKYLSYMRKNSSYGGQPEICALSHVLNRNIDVFKSDGDGYKTSGLGYTINYDNHDSDVEIAIFIFLCFY